MTMFQDCFLNHPERKTLTRHGWLNFQSVRLIILQQTQQHCSTDQSHSSSLWSQDQINQKKFILWLYEHPVVIFRYGYDPSYDRTSIQFWKTLSEFRLNGGIGWFWGVFENCANIRLLNDLWWPFFLSWTIWPICIDSQQTTLRRHTSLYLYPAQQKLIEWLDQETFIFEFTFFNIINMKTEKVDETHVTKGVHRVGGTDLELISTTNFNFDSIYS